MDSSKRVGVVKTVFAAVGPLDPHLVKRTALICEEHEITAVTPTRLPKVIRRHTRRLADQADFECLPGKLPFTKA